MIIRNIFQLGAEDTKFKDPSFTISLRLEQNTLIYDTVHAYIHAYQTSEQTMYVLQMS